MSYQYIFYKSMYMYQLIENYMHDAYQKNKIPVSIKEHLGNYKLNDIDYLIIKEYLYTLKSKQYSVEYINSMILILTGCLEQEAIHLKREDVDLLSHKVKLTYKEDTLLISDSLLHKFQLQRCSIFS